MRLPTYLAGLLVLTGLALGGCRSEPPPDASPPDAPPHGAVPLTERFDPVEQPYAFVLPNLQPVAGVGGVRAEDCGKCHQAIYREWQGSTHANALRDIQFQAEITKKDSPKWLCLNCHIPVQNQRSYIVTHLEDDDILRPVTRPNPMFDPRMQKEGVTCASCHVRRDEMGDSYIIGPFENRYAPHPVRTDPDFLRNVCQRCHNPQGEGLTRNLVCWFETFRELETGRAALPPELRTSDCVTCHMPATQRRLVDSVEVFPHLPLRTSHRHTWPGGGVPKWYALYDSLLARGYAPALGVTVGPVRGVRPGGEARVEIRLTNRNAGHHLTTGDPERYLLTIAALLDADGDTLAQARLRIGQTWEWNPARKVADDRLAQGQTRLWPVALPLPDTLDGLRLDVTAYHVRLNTNNARYLMQAQNVDEALFPGGAHYVAHAVDYYPFASFIYKEEVDLRSGTRRVYSLEELIERSKAEKGKPLEMRPY